MVIRIDGRKGPVYASAKVTEEKCTGCRMCIFICPDPNVIKYVKTVKKVEVDQSRCKGCGLCTAVCPKGALAVSSL